jgi:hypothetical protein
VEIYRDNFYKVEGRYRMKQVCNKYINSKLKYCQIVVKVQFTFLLPLRLNVSVKFSLHSTTFVPKYMGVLPKAMITFILQIKQK